MSWSTITTPGGSGSGGGTRAGLFRTPISGGVQSATSAHGLPRPALAVRNLMEQVRCCTGAGIFYSITQSELLIYTAVELNLALLSFVDYFY